MSYDLYFVRGTDAASVVREYERVSATWEELDESAVESLDPDIEAWKRSLAKAVVSAIDGMAIWDRDFAAYAKREGCTEDEACRRWRTLEINEVPDVDCGPTHHDSRRLFGAECALLG